MAKARSDNSPVIRLGISACLLGRKVRFDGQHKRDGYLVETLGPFVKWVPVCPEVEVGMGTPRETIRLEGNLEDPRLVAPKSGIDHTADMKRWSSERLDSLDAEHLHGFILKRASPSCGAFRVKVYQPNGSPLTKGQGLFAAALMTHWPLLPVEEEGRLNDPRLRENFFERVFAWHRWREFVENDGTPKGLVAFHTAHKMSIMAHSVEKYRALGRLVADLKSQPWASLRDQYAIDLMTALKLLATPRKHANVLYHLLGHLKKVINSQARQGVVSTIEDYRLGLAPLIVPLTLLKHHVSMHELPDWVTQQVYLNPYPKELMLRNHV